MCSSDKQNHCAKCGVMTDHWLNPDVPLCLVCFGGVFSIMSEIHKREIILRNCIEKCTSLINEATAERIEARVRLVAVMDMYDKHQEKMMKMKPEDFSKDIKP